MLSVDFFFIRKWSNVCPGDVKMGSNADDVTFETDSEEVAAIVKEVQEL